MDTLSPDITSQQLQHLQRVLPELAFIPAGDTPLADIPAVESYLRFYNLHFDNRYFHRWGKVTLPGYTIACHYWLPGESAALPEKGMVMVLHGYFDHVGLYGHLIRHLLERGYGVVAFDLPGHGLSSGETASIESFDHYVDVFEAVLFRVKQAFPVPISAIGQSTGGAILLKHLAQGNTDLAKVTLLAPLVEPAMWWFNRFVYAITHRFRRGLDRIFMVNSGDPEFVDFLANADPLQARYIPIAWLGAMNRWVREFRAMKPCQFPVTIVQGTADTTLSWRTNLRLLRKRFPAASVMMIEGARHHLVNESLPLRQQVFDQLGF